MEPKYNISKGMFDTWIKMQGKITLVHSLSQKNPWVEEEVIVKELIEDSEGLTVDEDEWNFEKRTYAERCTNILEKQAKKAEARKTPAQKAKDRVNAEYKRKWEEMMERQRRKRTENTKRDENERKEPSWLQDRNQQGDDSN
jgi:hypothetical protein